MRSTLKSLFAFLMTALMVFECVPSLAWAEAAERMTSSGPLASEAQPLDAAAQDDASADAADAGEAVPLAEGDAEGGAGDDGALPSDGTTLEEALAQAASEQGVDPEELLSDASAQSNAEPATGDEPAADGEPASASDDFIVTDDPTMGGLVTQLPEGWTLEYATSVPSGANDSTDSFAWKSYPEWKNDDRTVWVADYADVTKWTLFGLQLLPKRSDGTVPDRYYMTYDYVLAYGDGGSFISSMMMNQSANRIDTVDAKASLAENYTDPESAKKYESEASITSDQWKTGFAVYSASNPVGVIVASLMGANGSPRMYLSNIKIYDSVDELPAEFTHTVEIENDATVGQVELKVAYASKTVDKIKTDFYDDTFTLGDGETGSVKLPIYCQPSLSYTPNDTSATFDGWWPSANAVEPTSRDNPYVPKAIKSTGTTHLEARVKRLAEIPDFTLYKMKPGDSEWTPVEVTDEDSMIGTVKNQWYRCEKWRADDEESAQYGWRIEIDESASQFDSIEVTDNGTPVELKDQYGNADYKDHEYYDLTPNNQTHHIQFNIKQKGVEDNVAHIILWPTLTWDQAFGVTDEETGESSIIGAKQDNTFENTDLNWFVERTLDDENLHDKHYAWVYDTEAAKEFADDDHQVVFTSSKATEDAITEVYFDFDDTVKVSFDYAIKTSDGADGTYDFYAAKQYLSGGHRSISSDYMGVGVSDGRLSEREPAKGDIGWTHVEFTSSRSSVYDGIVLRFENPGANRAVCAISNLKITGQAVTGSVKQFSKNQGSGTVTINGKTSEPSKYYINDTLKLEAAPAKGSQFIGWFDAGANKLLSDKASYRYTVTGDFEIEARFVATNNGDVALVYDNTYSTLSAAAKAAKSGQTILLLKNNVTVDDAVTIPTGVTLLLRLKDSDRSGYAVGKTGTREAWKTGTTAYQTLTVGPKGSLTVNGKLVVGGTRHAENQAAQGITSGAYAQLVNNGSVTINSGGTFTVNGLVTGTGTITAQSGSSSTIPYTVNDYSGGTNTEGLYNANDFPFHQYATPNVQCTYVVKSGATVTGSASLYFWSSIHTQNVPLVGKANGSGLILLGDGATLTATYNDTKALNATFGSRYLADFGKQTLTLEGSATAGVFLIDSYGSTGKYLCLPYNFDVVVKSGTLTVPASHNYRIMPGSTVTIQDDATLKVLKGGGLDVTNGWQQKALSGAQYPTTEQLKANGFSTAGNLVVDGTLELQQGATFTGVAQTNGTTGVVNVGAGVTLSKAYNVGASTQYDNSKASYSSKAQAWVGGKLTDLALNTSYAAAGAEEWQLPSYTMTATGISGTTVTTNQGMKGAWGVPQVTYHFNDNVTPDKTESPKAGSQVTLPTPSAREGFAFEGWYATPDFQEETRKGAGGDQIPAPGGALDLYAKWTELVYPVTFDPAGGTFAEGDTSERSVVVKHGEECALPTVSKTGYDFLGWYESGATKVEGKLENVTQAHALVARWSPTRYDITYKSAGGVDLQSVPGFAWAEGATDEAHPDTYTVEDVVALAAPTRTGYAFTGWTVTQTEDGAPVGEGGTIPEGTTGALTATASWTPCTYEVTFDPAGGELQDSSGKPLESDYSLTVTYDDRYDAEGEWPKAERAGATFSGWSLPAEDGTATSTLVTGESTVAITKPTRLVAAWDLSDFTISYNLAGGHWKAEDGDVEAEHGSYTIDTDPFIIPAPEREGYTFEGWYDGAQNLGTQVTIPPTSPTSLTLTATWKPIPHEVTFKAAGGTFENHQGETLVEPRDYDSPIGELPEVSRTGYELAGWQDESGTLKLASEVAETVVKGNATYTAQWTPISYNITYALGDDASWPAGASEKQHPASYDVTSSFTLATPVREGHTFTGWKMTGAATKGEGTDPESGTVTAGTTGKLEFTATWQRNSHNVTWVYGDGTTQSKTSQLLYGDSITEEGEPTKPGYRFDGWTAASKSGTAYGKVPATMPDDDLTITAQWTSYTDVLNAYVEESGGNLAALRGDALKTARAHWAELAKDSEQLQAYDATDLIDAVLNDALSWVNDILKDPQTGAQIATLTTGEGKDAHTLYVEMNAPATKAEQMLKIGFLTALFNADEVAQLLINNTKTGKGNQFDIMLQAAFAALKDQEDVPDDLGEFTDWLRGQQTTLTIGVLAGTSVTAQLLGANGKGPTYVVSFYDEGHQPGEVVTGTLHLELHGGTGAHDVTLKAGSVVSRPSDPTREGYDFAGWYTKADGQGEKFEFTDDTVMPEDDWTLHAAWTPHTYHVAFAGGTAGVKAVAGAMDTVDATYGEAFTLPECEFAPVGYSFAGWKLQGDASGRLYKDGEEGVKDLTAQNGATVTLVAQWAPNTYDVTFDAAGGTMPEGFEQSVRVTYDATYGAACAGGKLPQPLERAGYTFAGWWDDSVEPARQIQDGTTVAITGPQTLTAHWNERGDVHYEVHHYLQNLEDDGYPAEPSEVTSYDTGKTGTEVEAQQAHFDGFTIDPAKSELKGTVAGDGSLVLDLYYTRDSYGIVYKVGEASYQRTLRYGASAAYEGELSWEAVSGDYAIEGWELEGEGGAGTESFGPEGLPKVTGPATYVAQVHKAFEAQTPDGTHTWRTLQIAMEKAPELLGAAGSAGDGEADDGGAAGGAGASESQDTNAANGTGNAQGQSAGEGEPLEAGGVVADPVTGAKRVLVSLHGEPKADGSGMEAVAVPEGGLTVPESVMLLLPYTDGDTGYDTEDNNNQHIPGPPVNENDPTPHTGALADPSPYSTLVVPAGSTLTVEGTVLVNALVGRKAGGHRDQDVTGGWALLQADGEVVVEAGGTLDAHGYVRGGGTVTAESGGTVGDLYVVRNWRGGSQAMDAFTQGIYPMNETDCRHVEVPLTIEAGGRLDGLVTMNAEGNYYSTRFPQVDNANGLIRLHEGASATRTLVERGGETRERWEISGGADFGRSTLYIIQMDLSTGGFVFPVDGDTDWVLADGDYAFTEDFKFMPGAVIEAHGADLTVADGKTVVLYEPFDDPENTDGTQYPNDRPAATLALDKDSSLTNNGTFAGNVSAAGPDVHEGQFDVGWEATTKEVNGYFEKSSGVSKTAEEFVRHIDHGLTIECDGHEYDISERGEVLWDGEESDFHPEEELARAVRSAANKADALEGMAAKATLDGTDVALSVDLASEARASGSAVEALEDVVKALLDALERDSDMAGTASAGSGKDRYSVDLSKDTAGLPVRDLAKALGLEAAARARAGKGASPTGADLDGLSGTLTVSGTGFHAGASVRLAISFACSWEPAVAPSSPTAAPDTSELEPEAASIVEAAEPGRVELNGGGGDEAAPVEVAATVTDADAVTWTVTLADEAQEKPAADVAGSVIGSFLSSVAKSPEAVSRVSTVTGNPPEVTVELRDGGLPEDGLARILAKLGFAPASAQAQSQADGGTVLADGVADNGTGAQALADGGAALIAAGSAAGNAAQPFALADTGASAQGLADGGALIAAGATAIPDGNAQVLAEDSADTSGSTDTAGDVLVGESYKLRAESPKGDTVTFTFAFRAAPEDSEPKDPHAGLVAIYRLYNPNTGEHLLTSDANEYDVLGGVGWKQEGVASWQPEAEVDVAKSLPLAVGDTEGQAKQTLVYRLYNRSNGDHLYTTKENEVNVLARSGWEFEGVAFASADMGEGSTAAPVYRLWNPNMKRNGGVGSHLYTADENEYRTLGGIGWKQEGRYWTAAALPDD